MRAQPSGRTVALLLVALLAIMAAGAQVAIGALTWSETRLTDAPEDEADVSIWGDKIVFEQGIAGDQDEVFLYDISTGAQTRLTNDSVIQWKPVIYGDKVVWKDQRNGGEIFLYDLSTGTETRLTNDSVAQGEVMIHGNSVVWSQNNPGTFLDIYHYSLVDGTTTVIDNSPRDQDYPDVFGDTIVYEDYNTSNGSADIRMHSLIDGTTTKVTDGAADAKWLENEYDPRIWGNTVAWYDYRNSPSPDIWYYDIATGVETRLTSDTVNGQDYPTVFRDRIAYKDDTGSSDIHVADLGEPASYALTSSGQNQNFPAIWGNKVAWEDERDALSYDIWTAGSGLGADRSGGANRYETSALASSAHFSSAKTVVVATGTGFADALAASGLAGCYGGPLILTSGNNLSPAARTEIERLGATDAVIIGGEGAVSGAVEDELGNDMGLAVDRIGGANRYETSAMIADRIEALTGSMFEKTAFIARGDSFPDALAVSPLAYYNRFPILLTRTTGLPAETEKALADLDIEDAVIAGEEGAVSAQAKTALDAVLATNGGAASLRWGGSTRYETSVIVAEEACKKYWAGRGFVGLAVGNNFPDALSGGAAAGREFGVLLLTHTDSLPDPAKAFMTDSGDGVGWLEAFGGTGVVSDAVANEAVAWTGQ